MSNTIYIGDDIYYVPFTFSIRANKDDSVTTKHGWYHRNEIEGLEGPFSSLAEAEEACKAYKRDLYA